MVTLYDTTLRDGTQREGMSLSVEDKLRIAAKLDLLGVHYIEGGFPGSNPKDIEFFERARDLKLEQAVISAFGSTRRKGIAAAEDPGLEALLDTECKALCIVGKCWDLQVTEALGATLDEGIEMARDSVAYLKSQGRTVFFDAEHFFDGYNSNAEYAVAVCAAAAEAGADAIVLCDTNGGMLPRDVARIVADVKAQVERAARHPHAQRLRAAPSPTRSLRSMPAARRCRARSTATASAPATPTSSPSSAGSCSRWGTTASRRTSCACSPRSATSSLRPRTSSPTPRRRTWVRARSRTRAVCTRARRASSPAPTSTSSPRAWATSPASS